MAHRPTQREIEAGIENIQKCFNPRDGFRAGSDRDMMFSFMLNGITAEELQDVFPHKKPSKIKWEMGTIGLMTSLYYNKIGDENTGRVQLLKK
jgi:hypothetical protein